MDVLRVECVDASRLSRLLRRYELSLELVPARTPIPGSYWGAPEAGLVGRRVCARADTPVHSVLHESAHVVCMTPERRAGLSRDAGGDDLEESAVCYLQVLLSDELPELGRARAFRDMDSWGYSFRLGSTRAWFERDAVDARDWLAAQGLIDGDGRVSWKLRAAETVRA